MDYSPPGLSVHGISWQEYWSGLLIPFPGNLPHPRTEPTSSALAGRFIITDPPAKPKCLCFLDGSDGKASAYNVGDPGSIPGSGRSPGEGNGNPFQYSCLEKSHG